MQFDHAHNFRPQVTQLLSHEWPAAYDAWRRLGAEPLVPGPAGDRPRPGACSRAGRRSSAPCGARPTRSPASSCAPGTSTASPSRARHRRRRGRGGSPPTSSSTPPVAPDGSARVPAVTGSPTGSAACGLAYVDRTYRLREGAGAGPMNTPLGFIGELRGYQLLVFLHELGHFSVVLIRPTADPDLTALHDRDAFEAACRAVPVLAEWTDPARAHPTSDVLVGGALRNVYRDQDHLPGLVTVGDAVATTTPTRGRGVAMACLQIEALLRLLDAGADPVSIADPFGAWCEENIRPWVADHIAIDGGMERAGRARTSTSTLP